ncbi:ribosome biogenesis protein NOP53-like [Liolophura sinensis]|uniref:ribosome biogenesis protein NOP53-like n=1 Tax=Liolophura sinensis TaxID=3198878 RepID=UPI003158B8AA
MMEEPTRVKRKRVSKNKKKSWRKHTDITDVEEALDDERMQQRTGGLAAEKPDETLFFVDKATDNEEVVGRRRLRPLRCYANLEPDLNTVPAFIKRNGRVPKSKTNIRERKTKKQVMAEEQRRKALRQRKIKQSMSEALPQSTYDLWSGKKNTKNTEGEEVETFYLEYTKQRRVQPPSHYREKTSGLPAVSVPHPGASYNPAFDDHQDLLMKAVEIEKLKEKKEKKLEKSLDAKFPSKEEAPTEETWLSEMSAGLFDGDVAHEDEGSSDDNDRLSVNPAVRREGKKTRRQRRIEKERKAQEKALQQAKTEKQRKQELLRLKSIKTEIKAREYKLEQRQNRKTQLRTLYKDKPKRLGKFKFEEPEIELKLSDELTGSLRELKPEGHLLEDRFKALQRRNVIETRKRAKLVRKYKPKKFEKKGHKAVTI